MILAKLPEHLKKFDSDKTRVAMNGTTFRPAMEHWFDPVSETMFWSNGNGYFESGSWALSEHPDIPLERWNLPVEESPPKVLGGTTYGIDEFRDLLEAVVKLAPPRSPSNPNIDPPHWWRQDLTKQCEKLGVQFQYERVEQKNSNSLNFLTNIKGYTEGIDERVRRYFSWKHKASKMHPEFQPTRHKMEKGSREMSTEESLNVAYGEIADLWEESGREPDQLLDLFYRVCDDAKLPQLLTEESLELFKPAVMQELNLIHAQNEAAAAQSQAKEQTAEQQIEHEKLRKELFGKEVGPAPQRKHKKDPEAEKEKEIYNQRQQRLLTILAAAEQAGVLDQIKVMHKDLARSDGDKGLSENTLDSLDEALEVLKEMDKQDLNVLDSVEEVIETSVDGGVASFSVSEVAPPVVAEEKPKSKKGGKKKSAKEETSTLPEQPPYENFYESLCSNIKDGTTKPFSSVLGSVFDALHWKKYHLSKAKAQNALIRGTFFLYWGSILEIVHAQFMRQYRKETNEFRPKTVKTRWGTFAREEVPNGGWQCTDLAKFQNWLDDMTPEEAVMNGATVRIEMTDEQAKLAIAQGIKVPGYQKLEPDPNHDPVGKIYLVNTKPMLKNLEKEPIDPEDQIEREDSDESEDDEAA